MRKKRTPVEKKMATLIKKPGMRGILPFTGHPSDNISPNHYDSNERLPAADLFSFFTADIIKQKKLFIR